MPPLLSQLHALGVIDETRLEPFYPRVRDRADVAVLRDPVTEVIVLSGTDHISARYYETRAEKVGHTVHGSEVATPRLGDDQRRAADFGRHLRDKRWLDFGCGLGGMLDEMHGQARWAAGLEPNRARADTVAAKGHKVVGGFDELAPASLDVITMFHVLEHLTDPVATLAEARTRLRPGGGMLVEVPHARDALFTLYDSEPFKRFTFWSEHLVLHTRQSLETLLQAAGYGNVEVSGYQRYPLANHLHWLSRGRPGGHEAWRFLSAPGLDAEYESMLSGLDRTDTLIAWARA